MDDDEDDDQTCTNRIPSRKARFKINPSNYYLFSRQTKPDQTMKPYIRSDLTLPYVEGVRSPGHCRQSRGPTREGGRKRRNAKERKGKRCLNRNNNHYYIWARKHGYLHWEGAWMVFFSLPLKIINPLLHTYTSRSIDRSIDPKKRGGEGGISDSEPASMR